MSNVKDLQKKNKDLQKKNEELEAELVEAKKATKKAEVSAWADALQPEISKYDPI